MKIFRLDFHVNSSSPLVCYIRNRKSFKIRSPLQNKYIQHKGPPLYMLTEQLNFHISMTLRSRAVPPKLKFSEQVILQNIFGSNYGAQLISKFMLIDLTGVVSNLIRFKESLQTLSVIHFIAKDHKTPLSLNHCQNCTKMDFQRYHFQRFFDE